MGYKQAWIVAFLLIALSCSASRHSERYVEFGGSATPKDLAYIYDNWGAIKRRIADFDGRNCVAAGLGLEDLEFVSVEGLGRLSVSATDFQHNVDPDDVKKIFGLAFRDPCGSEASPAWVIVDTVKGFFAIDFIMIEE